MTYFTHFGLEREPFGTTPDPAMFYRTLGHEDCYERLKLAIARRILATLTGNDGVAYIDVSVPERPVVGSR